jgi:hypothetical protein
VRPRHLAALLALAISRPAAAESHKLLVLQSEGRADAATRAKIDAAIFKLALSSEPQAAAGELNFSDAATAVGCKPDTALCKDEVLGMLSVDEIVITTVTPKPGGLEITVRRFAKGGAMRDATMLIAAGAPTDKLDGIAPLFGDKPPASPAGTAVTTTDRPAAPGPGDPTAIPPPATIAQEPAPSPVAQPAPTELTAMQAEPPSTRGHRLEIAGMAGGATLLVLGVVLWSAASGVQSDIDNAPTSTKQDLQNLKDLESKGDGYAGLGNLLAIGGVILGGVSTYLYIKDRRATSTATARLTPTVFDHGAGVVFTIGGSP